MWMPWNPEAYKTGRVEYLEDELNQLMAEKTYLSLRQKVFYQFYTELIFLYFLLVRTY